MNFFRLNDTACSSDIINEFPGLNLSEKKIPGQLASAMNVSTELYPFLTEDTKTYKIKEHEGSYGAIALCDKLFECVTVGAVTKAYYGGLDTGLALTAGKKRLVRMGTRLIIFPDKKWYDAKSGESGLLEAFFESADGVGFRFELCDIDGATVNATFSPVAPASAAVGSYWCDTSCSPYALKFKGEDMWTEIYSVYTKITCPNAGVNFKAGDGVRISVGASPLGGGFHVLETVTDDFVIIPGIYTGAEASGALKIERRLPLTDIEIECANRIWACRWGLNNESEFVNEIYASKLGDPTNFECFEGISSDSYALSLGSEGAFCGAVCYLGNPIFFKEKCFHKIFGSRPADFSVVTVDSAGPAVGCENSFALCDDILYYVSKEGVTMYDGAFPRIVSDRLGGIELSEVSGASYSGKVLFSGMADGRHRTFVLDSRKLLWSEREYLPLEFSASLGDSLLAAAGGSLYLLGAKESAAGSAVALCAGDAPTAEEVKWSFETGNLCPRFAEYVYKLVLRIKVATGATVSVSAQYYDGGEFESVGVIRPCVERSYSIPIHTHRTDFFRLRFEGKGHFVLYSIARFTDKASENALFRF